MEKELDYLDMFTFRIIGNNAHLLLNAIIALHNDYVTEFRKGNKGKIHKIKWFGGMRISVNDACFITNWSRNKVNSWLGKLSTGITHKGTTFKLLTDKPTGSGKGTKHYYSINIEELNRLNDYVDNYKSAWIRDNDKWMKENGNKQYNIYNGLKVMAMENYGLLERRFIERQNSDT